MIYFDLLFLILFISLTFTVIGFAKKQYFLVLIGGVSILFAGLLSINGVMIQSGSIINTLNESLINVTNTYEVLYSTFPSPFGTTLTIISLGLMLIGMLALFSKEVSQKRFEEDDDD